MREDNTNEIIDVDFTPIEEDVSGEVSAPSFNELQQLMKTCRTMYQQTEMIYNQLRDEFQLTEDIMNKLSVYNNNHMDPLPENAIVDNVEFVYDPVAGLDNITEEEVLELVGKDSSIICDGVHSLTIDRLKSSLETYMSMIEIGNEYKKLTNDYQLLIDEAEKLQILAIEEAYDAETDPGKKAILKKTLDDYYNGIQLTYLADELSEKDIKRIKDILQDEARIKYIIDKVLPRLDKLNISRKYILEISKFETRFLDEKYHKQDGSLLMYIMQYIKYRDIYDKRNKMKIVTTAIILDKFVRNTLDPELREKILQNIIAFEDQLLNG